MHFLQKTGIIFLLISYCYILTEFSMEAPLEIKRNRYLQKPITYMWNGQVKDITEIRRCGKSYLLRTLFKDYLLDHSVPDTRILSFELDLARDIRFRNPLELAKHVRNAVENRSGQFYRYLTRYQTPIIKAARQSLSTTSSTI